MEEYLFDIGAPDNDAGCPKTSKRRCVIDDGFNPELVSTALFDGQLEMPKVEKNQEGSFPQKLIPFSQRNRSRDFSEFVSFYEHDVKFSEILQSPEAYLDDFRRFQGIISPDFSLYRDMPLLAQMANTYRNRALACFFQKNGIRVIPNVRWSDERSYTTQVFPERFAFLGLPQHSMVSIGTYGCIRGRENCYHFRAGLEAMIETLLPEAVLVYGPMPEKIFGSVKNRTCFQQYPDWISCMKGGRNGNR